MANVTIDDIARIAGVSRQTVSKAINGKDRIAAKTRARILAVCDKVGYSPNVNAQRLAGGKSEVVGLALFAPEPNFTSFSYAPMFNAAINRLSELQRDIGLFHLKVTPQRSNSDPVNSESIMRLRRIIRSGMAGSLILIGDLLQEHLHVLEKTRLEMVYLGNYDVPSWMSQVAVDLKQCMDAFVSYVRGCGYRCAAFAYPATRRGKDTFQSAAWRCFKLAAAAGGLKLLPPASSAQRLQSQVCAAARKGRRLVLVCNSDVTAVSWIQRLREQGLEVPAAVAVTGFGNTLAPDFCRPRLTTVDFNYEEMARLAVDLLVNGNSRVSPVHMQTAGRIVVRESLPPLA